MRKRIMQSPGDGNAPVADWLDLETLAIAEISSEEPAHPVEGALLPDDTRGWRASAPGEQTLRLHFDQPQAIRRIWLKIDEPERERAQEFALRWSSDGVSFQEILRQQWHFSPGGSTVEVEDYEVALSGVASLELIIQPDRNGGEARASLTGLRLAA